MKTILNFIKKNRNIILLIISFVFLTMLILGMTYAYFDLKTSGETESTMNIGGAEISATYAYGRSINITDALPGTNHIARTKVNIKYKNTSNEEYKIYLKAVIDYNTFTNEENGGVLKYVIAKDDEDEGDEGDTIQTQTTFPTITSGKAILKEISIPANSNGKLEYEIKFYFPESDKLQNPDGQLVLNASISVESDNSLKYTPTLLKQIEKMYLSNAEVNGLEQDDTTDKNIRYVGAAPKNYLYFNDELWRIIGIFNVYNTETKKTEKMVKIVRNDALGNYSWDTSESSINSGYGINEWSQADLMTELNTDYLDTSKTSGTVLWYNDVNNSKKNPYMYKDNIKSSSIDKIANVRWNLGGTSSNQISALSMYNNERGTAHISNPSDGITRTNTWDGKIGLIYPSDYGYASTDAACRNNLSNADKSCKNNNWLSYSSMWTLTSYTTSSYDPAISSANGFIGFYNTNHAATRGTIFPTLYLKSNIILSSGTGDVTNPYKTDYNAFRDDSWETIVSNVRNGKSNLYKVGSEKEVIIDNVNYTVRLANNSTPSECNNENFSQTACGFVVEFVDIIEQRAMNINDTNVGAWPSSEMRTYANGEFYNKLPSDLKNIIITTKVISGHGIGDTTNLISENDKVYLLSSHELWSNKITYNSNDVDTAYSQTRQLDYYKNNGVTTSNSSLAIKKYNFITNHWWLRTPNFDGNNNFLIVGSNGYWYGSKSSALYGFSPAFRIG